MSEILNFDSTVTSTQCHESQLLNGTHLLNGTQLLNSTIGPEFNLTRSTTGFQQPKVTSQYDSMDSVEPEVEKWATPEVIQRVGKEFGKENSLNVLLNSIKLD